MKNFLLLAFSGLVLFSLASCGGDNNNNCAFGIGFSTEINDELSAVIDASVEYGNDPSVENCEGYKSAYRDYIDALRSLRSCYVAYGSIDDYNEALEEAEDDLDDLDCD